MADESGYLTARNQTVNLVPCSVKTIVNAPIVACHLRFIKLHRKQGSLKKNY